MKIKENKSKGMKAKRIGVKQLVTLAYGGLLILLSPAQSEQLPEKVFGVYQFWGKAGKSVVDQLTITENYFIFGNYINGICSGSYDVKRLEDSKEYPNQLHGRARFPKDMVYEIYLLSMKKPPCNNGVDSIQLAFSNKDQNIKELALVTYEKNNLSGWYSTGESITKLPKSPRSLYKCKEDGSDNQMAQCLYDKLNKEDEALRTEFNNDELWKKWRDAREGVCHHIKERQFRGGSIRPLMKASCELRLNSEMQKFCLNGEDKTCG
mgnify:CR=1 FL=1